MALLRNALLVLGVGGLSFAAVAACGSSDDSATHGGTTTTYPDGGVVTTLPDGAVEVHAAPVPFDQLIPGFVDAICSGIEACCQNAGEDFTAGACSAQLSVDAGLAGSSVVLAVPAASGLTYDPQAGGDCLALFRTFQAQCKTPSASVSDYIAQSISALGGLSGFTSCAKLFTGGTKAVGESCLLPYDCKASVPGATATCFLDSPKDGGLPSGRCVEILPAAAAGAHCTGSLETFFEPGGSGQYTPCANDPGFDPSKGTLAGFGTCDDATHTCTSIKPLANGQSCKDAFAGTCGAAAYCNDQDVCAPILALGADCKSSDACGPSAACDTTTRKCVARVALGAACKEKDDCISNSCNKKQVCSSAIPGIANSKLCSGK